MACYCLWMLQIVVELGQTDLVYCDLIHKFLIHFLNIATAINKPISEQGIACWLLSLLLLVFVLVLVLLPPLLLLLLLLLIETR